MQDTRIRSLGWEDPLEKGIAIHSSILAWRIPWTEKSGGAQFMGLQRIRHDWMTNTHTHTHMIFIPVLYIYHVVSPISMTLNSTYTFRHKFRNHTQSPDQNSLLHAKPSSWNFRLFSARILPVIQRFTSILIPWFLYHSRWLYHCLVAQAMKLRPP